MARNWYVKVALFRLKCRVLHAKFAYLHGSFSGTRDCLASASGVSAVLHVLELDLSGYGVYQDLADGSITRPRRFVRMVCSRDDWPSMYGLCGYFIYQVVAHRAV